MRRVYLCLGKSAEVPFYFERARVHVWNVEELCYFFKENIWVLEPKLLSAELTEWIRSQCDLAKLASILEAALGKEGAVEAFVEELFSYTGYYGKEETEKVKKILSANADSNELKRQKARGDYFLESGHPVSALTEYEELLAKPLGTDQQFLASIWHSKGVAQAEMFWFERAADSFEKAYRIWQSPESAEQYLAAKRMYLTTEAYVDFLAQRPDLYPASLELEKKLEQLDLAWKQSEEAKETELALASRMHGDTGACEELIREKLGPLQDAYRQAAAK